MKTHLGFASVQVRDLEASRTFYTDVIGWEVAPSQQQGAAVFQDEAGAVFAIRKPFEQTDTSQALGVGVGLWFAVPDADAAHARMLSGGAEIVAPPKPGPFGRMFTLRDPDGYLLTFYGG